MNNFTIHRNIHMFSCLYSSINFSAFKYKVSNCFSIYDSHGTCIGNLMKNKNGLANNHCLFLSAFSESIFIIVNSKYSKLDNVSLYKYAYHTQIDDPIKGHVFDINNASDNSDDNAGDRHVDQPFISHLDFDSDRRKRCKELLGESSLCILYPTHEYMKQKKYIETYKKYGITGSFTFKCNTYNGIAGNGVACNTHETILETIPENYSIVINKYFTIPSSKNFNFSFFDDFIMNSHKIANHAFYIRFNSTVYTEMHAFLTFLSFCF